MSSKKNNCVVSARNLRLLTQNKDESILHLQGLQKRLLIKFPFASRHNQRFAAGLETFDVSINYFADWFSDELDKFAAGAQKEPYDFNQIIVRPKTDQILNRTDIPTGPSSIDWNGKGEYSEFEPEILIS